jgi:hypothetical protein
MIRGDPDPPLAARHLAQQPPRHRQQHQEPAGEQRLDDDERRPGEGEDLQRHPEPFDPQSRQPQPAVQEVPDQRDAKALLAWRPPRLDRLYGDAQIEEDRGDDRGDQPGSEHPQPLPRRRRPRTPSALLVANRLGIFKFLADWAISG